MLYPNFATCDVTDYIFAPGNQFYTLNTNTTVNENKIKYTYCVCYKKY
jgi:hypothetical protein